jgi:hypothetical protein
LPVCIVDVEAENRISLRDFSRVMLRRVDGQPYAHSMLIEGNDDRGINVGLMTKTGFDIDTVRTHIFIFDLGQNDLPIFSRDCVSTSCAPRAGAEVLVLVNHFKSKRGGADARRLRQATRVKEIVMHACLSIPTCLCSVTSTTPRLRQPAPLINDTPLKDISMSSLFDDGGFPGTFGTQAARNKIDYVLLSPSLLDLDQLDLRNFDV